MKTMASLLCAATLMFGAVSCSDDPEALQVEGTYSGSFTAEDAGPDPAQTESGTIVVVVVNSDINGPDSVLTNVIINIQGQKDTLTHVMFYTMGNTQSNIQMMLQSSGGINAGLALNFIFNLFGFSITGNFGTINAFNGGLNSDQLVFNFTTNSGATFSFSGSKN